MSIQLPRQTSTQYGVQNAQAIPQAFGADIAQANQQLASQVGQTAGAINEEILQFQFQKEQGELFSYDTEATREVQDILLSQDIGDGNKPKGLLNRNFENATDITKEYDTKFETIKQKYLQKTGSINQRNQMERLLNSLYEQSRARVLTHEANEFDKTYVKSLDANISTRINNATLSLDINDLDKQITQTTELFTEGAKVAGYSKEMRDEKLQAIQGEMAFNAMSAKIDTDFATSKAIYEKYKGSLSREVIIKMESAIKGKELDLQKESIWNQVSGLSLADGTPDEQRMFEYVESNVENREDRADILKFINAKAGEKRSQMMQQYKASETGFLNKASELRANGQSLELALKQIPNYAKDPNQARIFRDIAEDIFAPRTQMVTNPEFLLQLDLRASQRDLSINELAQYFRNGQLSRSEFLSIGRTLVDNTVKGQSDAERDVYAYATTIASGKFSSQQNEDRAKFLFNVRQNTRGKTYEEGVKYVNDQLKDVVIEPRKFWFDKTGKQYDITFQSDVAESDKIAKQRTSAIQELRKNGERVTEESIKRFINKNPNIGL